MSAKRWHIVFREGESIETGFRTTSRFMAHVAAFWIGISRPLDPTRVCIASAIDARRKEMGLARE